MKTIYVKSNSAFKPEVDQGITLIPQTTSGFFAFIFGDCYEKVYKVFGI